MIDERKNSTTAIVSSWEQHLLDRATAGDEAAFELLADLYRPMLISMSSRLLRNSEDAKDAVQDTLFKTFRAIRDFDPSRPFRPWLCRICVNCCVDSARHHRRETSNLDAEEHVLESGDHVDEQAAGSVRQGQILDAIQRLPHKYRTIILMRHFKHMEVSEIARELETPEGTIKSWLFRARALLRKDLRPAMG